MGAGKYDKESVRVESNSFVEIEYNGVTIRKPLKDWHQIALKDNQHNEDVDKHSSPQSSELERFIYLAESANFHLYSSDLWKGTAERFAKMVVLDCLDIAEADGNTATANKIRKHFNIEKTFGWTCPVCGLDPNSGDPCPKGIGAHMTGPCPMKERDHRGND
jgi:hypothetical protein